MPFISVIEICDQLVTYFQGLGLTLPSARPITIQRVNKWKLPKAIEEQGEEMFIDVTPMTQRMEIDSRTDWTWDRMIRVVVRQKVSGDTDAERDTMVDEFLVLAEQIALSFVRYADRFVISEVEEREVENDELLGSHVVVTAFHVVTRTYG